MPEVTHSPMPSISDEEGGMNYSVHIQSEAEGSFSKPDRLQVLGGLPRKRKSTPLKECAEFQGGQISYQDFAVFCHRFKNKDRCGSSCSGQGLYKSPCQANHFAEKDSQLYCLKSPRGRRQLSHASSQKILPQRPQQSCSRIAHWSTVQTCKKHKTPT